MPNITTPGKLTFEYGRGGTQPGKPVPNKGKLYSRWQPPTYKIGDIVRIWESEEDHAGDCAAYGSVIYVGGYGDDGLLACYAVDNIPEEDPYQTWTSSGETVEAAKFVACRREENANGVIINVVYTANTAGKLVRWDASDETTPVYSCSADAADADIIDMKLLGTSHVVLLEDIGGTDLQIEVFVVDTDTPAMTQVDTHSIDGDHATYKLNSKLSIDGTVIIVPVANCKAYLLQFFNDEVTTLDTWVGTDLSTYTFPGNQRCYHGYLYLPVGGWYDNGDSTYTSKANLVALCYGEGEFTQLGIALGTAYEPYGTGESNDRFSMNVSPFYGNTFYYLSGTYIARFSKVADYGSWESKNWISEEEDFDAAYEIATYGDKFMFYTNGKLCYIETVQYGVHR